MRAAWVAAALFVAWPSAHASEFCDVEGLVDEVRTQRSALWELFKDKKFDELDAALSKLVAQYEAGKISDNRLGRYLIGWAQPHPGVETLAQSWIDQHPKSYAAWYALAAHYEAVGWAARGGEYITNTSEDQIAGMQRNFRRAAVALEKADTLVKRRSLSDAMRIDMGAGAGFDDPGEIYRTGIKAWPDSLEIRVQYVRKSAPKWGGSIEQLASIIADAKPLPPADRRYIEYLVYQEIGEAYWCSEPEGCGGKFKTRKGTNARRVTSYLQKSIPLCPGLDGSVDKLMQYQVEMRDWAAVIPTATALIKSRPRSGDAYVNRGAAYGNTGKLKESFADYERASQLGNGYGSKELAWFYESGTVVAKDIRKAIDLYLTADLRKVQGARQEAERLSRASGVPLR